MDFDGFDGIFRTGWDKATAGGKKRRDQVLIPADTNDKKLLQCAMKHHHLLLPVNIFHRS